MYSINMPFYLFRTIENLPREANGQVNVPSFVTTDDGNSEDDESPESINRKSNDMYDFSYKTYFTWNLIKCKCNVARTPVNVLSLTFLS